MSHIRHLLHLLLILPFAGFLLAAPNPPAIAPRADDKARQALDDALAKLDRKDLQWFTADFRLHTDIQGLSMQAQGTYQAGPDFRMRLDLKAVVGSVQGRLDIISDGVTRYEIAQYGEAKPSITRSDVQKVLGALQNPNLVPQAREEFFAFGGPATLLEALKKKMVPTAVTESEWEGIKVRRITFAYPEETYKKVTQDGKSAWPAYVPRQCIAVVDADTGWPYRLEWWGKGSQTSGESLLTSLEFLNPKLNQELPADTFVFKGDKKEAKNITEELIKRLDERSKQLGKE